MARDTEGGARKNALRSWFQRHQHFFFLHKFAISLKGRCKLGLLTNELLGQDMYSQ